MAGEKPVLFIDIDGPLNPYGAQPHCPPGYTEHRFFADSIEWGSRGLPVYLNPAHGPLLLALPYELVWGTTWESRANEWVGQRTGLPELPFVTFTSRISKIYDLMPYAGRRPFAWIDDDITPADLEVVAEAHAAPALLHWVDPAIGLVPEDFSCLAQWAADLAAGKLPLPGSCGTEEYMV